MRRFGHVWARWGLLLAAGATVAACKGAGSVPTLSKEEAPPPLANSSGPAADGGLLTATADRVPILDQPRFASRVIGELRAGASIGRSASAVSRDGCPAGWFAVRPRGFVCAGAQATLDAGAPTWLPKPPDLTKPLPYRYGRARSEGVPVYGRLPSHEEQMAAEPDLAKFLTKIDLGGELYGAAANDVPLDARGVASGPPIFAPTSDGVDVSLKRTGLSFFTFNAERTAASFPAAALGELRLRKSSGVALTGGAETEAGPRPRRFGITPQGNIVPTDRLKPALGTIWHGADLDGVGLPLAFVHKSGVHTWMLKKAKATKNDAELDRRLPVPLSGKFRTIDGIRFEQTREGYWLRAQDLVVIVKRHKFPEFAKGTQKWLDVSLANQTITAYEGTKPVYATLMSSGRDVLGDPNVAAATPRGTFHITSKHVSLDLDNREVQQAFDVSDAPWAAKTDGGFEIAATYWGDGIGEAQTFHGILLAPIDARRLWRWSDPQVPEGWHAAYESAGEGTVVLVRP